MTTLRELYEFSISYAAALDPRGADGLRRVLDERHRSTSPCRRRSAPTSTWSACATPSATCASPSARTTPRWRR